MDILKDIVLEFSGSSVMFDNQYLQKVLVEYISRAKVAGYGRQLQYASKLLGVEDNNSLSALKHSIRAILITDGYVNVNNSKSRGRAEYVKE